MKPQRTTSQGRGGKSSGQPRRSGLSRGQAKYYSRSRQRNHSAAEADGNLPDLAILDHPLVCGDEPTLIADQAGLDELLDHLRGAGSFAYDTEFIGELTYYPELCVIQVATVGRVALVDPLASLDLSGFWALVADRSVETVVHAGVQDLEPVYRHTGRGPEGIFDTQIALGFADLPYPLSLREAVRLLLGAKMGKGMTFTQWDQRPLSAAQMRYAADDVRYLPALRATLTDLLAKSSRARWAAQECESLSDPALYLFDPLTQSRRVRGTRDLTARQLAILISLLQWREQCARDQGIPARSLVRDEVLKAMARKRPRSTEDLIRAAALPRSLIHSEGERIVQAADRAAALDKEDLPTVRPTVESGILRHKIDCAWAFVQAYCFGRSVHPNLVASRQELADLLAGKSLAAAIAESRVGQGWRKEFLGDRFEGILAGTAAMHLRWSEGKLRAQLDDDAPTAAD